ncbi:MAG: hypothetical protein AABX35_00015 [Nanoarchaeota archaeon]
MNLTRMLKTSALALGVAGAVGCSAPVKAYVVGVPLSDIAKRDEDLRSRSEAEKTIVPVKELGPGYFRIETRNSAYSANNESRNSRYVEPKEPAGIILLRFPFGK